ncbi:hypothetical protein NM208_g12081 [Fusarium decemcellulare]|uniref:Uncharacterized protein n=1 Tax=Fusarium decemcellulare TaxID=57161 RepID=A0ACC1RRU3_9HYPO|nr:hypothetical protein NM208_g12081 [Fusarium decemcellulare]
MTSNPQFDSNTTGTEVAAALGGEIRGRNVVITGVSPESIGASTALAIASQSPSTLVLASRTKSKVETVAKNIKAKYPTVTVKVVILDLSSIDSIKSAAAEINSTLDRIDILINNAGVSQLTRDPVITPGDIKVDLQFFTNHLGPFLFTELLLPGLLKAGSQAGKGEPRIVNLSSHGHRLSPIRFSDYAFERELYDGVPEEERPPTTVAPGFLQIRNGYAGFIGYGQSKTANVLHSVELTRRLQSKGANVMALAVHPGSIETGLNRNLDDKGKETLGGTAPGGVWKSIDEGAATTLVAAFDPKLVEIESRGYWYLADCQLADQRLADHARDPKAAERLWAETEKMLGITSII